jgi:hypothetical protein
MRMLTTTAAALGIVGAVTVGTPSAGIAQGFYVEGPGVSFGVGNPRYRYHRYHRYYGGPYAYSGRYHYGRPWYERRYYRNYRHYRHW